MAAKNTRPGREPEVLLSSTLVPLRREFTAGIYSVEKATRGGPRYSNQERLLIVHFRWLFFSLAVWCLLRFGEKPAILRATSVLQYFANVVGQRVNTGRFGNLTAEAMYLPY